MPQDTSAGTPFEVGRSSETDLERAIVETAADAILTLTSEGQITGANWGAERLYGYRREDLIGRTLGVLVPDEHWRKDRELIARAAGGQQIEHLETQHKRRDGELIEVSVTLSAIHDASGRVIALSSIARDIGKPKREAEEFRRLERLRSEFVSKVSHELRNPLATIRGLAFLMTDAAKEPPAEERRRFSEAIVRQVDHLVKLVDDILQVSNMDAGDFTYAIIDYDPRALLEEAVAQARAAYPEHKIDLDAPTSLPTMRGDPERIGQVLSNLLANACRYSDEGTIVTVTAAGGDGRLEVAVGDQGVGIEPDHFPNLFGRFSRIPRKELRHVKGTGLGLYICKGIVEAHGGTISVESEPGSGSTFRFSLPVQR